MKDFDSWNEVKKELNRRMQIPKFYAGDIWWCSIGINIDCEEDGKNESFDRPVLVFRKLARNKFYGIPLSTQPQRFENYMHAFKFDGKDAYVLLDQMRVMSANRLREYGHYKISKKNYAIIKHKLGIILGYKKPEEKISPPDANQEAAGTSSEDVPISPIVDQEKADVNSLDFSTAT